ncbi:hypothetical protein [Cryobacterium sp. Y11]|uniref:DUF7687 domain-containing protein n=1 Tax=Cryobacterium sp. Y11 TaxID=2045016 RepID=UPI0011B0A236|nr:hypothetical protein [Cryobacterium sp. Y11]
MKADTRWRNEGDDFWAYVRVLSESIGYTVRGQGIIRTFTTAQIVAGLESLGRSTDEVEQTNLGQRLVEYFDYRAYMLNDYAKASLMTAQEARETFEKVVNDYTHASREIIKKQNGELRAVAMEYDLSHGGSVRVPMNKQKDEKRTPSYLTGIVNILVSHHLGGRAFDADPRQIPVVDKGGKLHAAMSRRMDGAYPSSVNPVALWELKEYYYTTTFGSKISDAVYVSQLDGYERNAIRASSGIDVKLYLMVDAYGTWWEQGKSYLCRLVDMLNYGTVDELLIGRDCVSELPRIVGEWIATQETTQRFP